MIRLRWVTALFGVVLAVTAAGPGFAAGPTSRAAPGPVATVLMDVRTGQVLYAREPHRRWPPASTTKILTALLAIERLRSGSLVTISKRAANQRNGTALGLEAGERWTVDDLLHAMMVHSANDAAVAVAEAIAGSLEKFAELMNARARRLGARGSHFTNPHGLHHRDHYSTAYDLALIARYALHHPVFAALARTRVWVLERPDRPLQEYVNTNKLLARYEGADGVKTGWIAASGQMLVASATRQGWQLLAVIVDGPDAYRDAEQLLDYGFASFEPVQVGGRGERLASVAVGSRRARLDAVLPDDVHAVVPRGVKVSPRVRIRQDLRPPIPAGAPVGRVEFVAGNAVVARSTLVAAQTISR